MILMRLQAKAKNEAKTCGETALFLAACYYWHSDRHEKARDLVDRLLKLNPNSQTFVC
jgi:tetratricopeptide repeat protein 21B